MLEEANRLGIWLICPPRLGRRPPRTGRFAGQLAEFGPQFDCVLAWDLGGDLTGADLDATQRWADLVGEADHRISRPMICRPRSDLCGFSRLPAIAVDRSQAAGHESRSGKYAAWVHPQPCWPAPGTPVWTTVQTQPNEALRQQLVALDPGYVPPLTVSPEQIRLMAYTAVVREAAVWFSPPIRPWTPRTLKRSNGG